MQPIEQIPLTANRQSNIRKIHIILAFAGLAALCICYLAAVSDLAAGAKTAVFVAVAALYLLICAGSFYSQPQPAVIEQAEEIPETEEEQDVLQELAALEEASLFFGNSLNAADMFRLVSSRIADIVPHSASLFFVVENEKDLKLLSTDGEKAEFLSDMENTAAGKALAGKKTVVSENTAEAKELGFQTSAAIPLFRDGAVFAVLQFFSKTAIASDKETKTILEAIGERVGPLFSNSIAFERSLSNALTDPLTELPNERAFFMILENQLAESQRYRDERPLTILAMDIKNFSEANENFGHAAGDRVLKFTGQLVREQLRKMDFLARAVNDEFVLILPTANEKTAVEIVERIKAAFAGNELEIVEGEKIKVRLNFGLAAFWHDGETPEQLLRHAQLRKQQAKSEEPNKVLWFPKEYVN